MATTASESLSDSRTSHPRMMGTRWLVPLTLAAAGALCLTIDLPVADYFRSGHSPKFLRELLEHAEPFGHGVGVVYIVLAIFVLDVQRRSWVPALLGGSLGAGLSADIIKLLIGRTRPRNLDASLSSVWETFGNMLPLLKGIHGDSHSFPSSHTATAVGLAVVLATLYPQGRYLFFTFALLTGLQRIACSAHFPSDVCAGALVGWVFGHAILAVDFRYRERMETTKFTRTNNA